MTVVFVEDKVPEPKLEQTLVYKGFLSGKEKEEILKELKKSVDTEDYTVHMHVHIELKKYKN